LKEPETEIATALVHLEKLLRVRNLHRSPLLQLPTEIIIHTLSFVMEDVGSWIVWWSAFTTWYGIYEIMYDVTSLCGR